MRHASRLLTRAFPARNCQSTIYTPALRNRPAMGSLTAKCINGVGNEIPSTAWHRAQPNGYEGRRYYSKGQDSRATDTEFLIVGAGPAGASLACFLASYGESSL
jgi:hypothetical protein